MRRALYLQAFPFIASIEFEVTLKIKRLIVWLNNYRGLAVRRIGILRSIAHKTKSNL